MTSRADDDQVDIEIVGACNDLVDGIADQELGGRAYAVLLRNRFRFDEKLTVFLADFVRPRSGPHAEGRYRDDVQTRNDVDQGHRCVLLYSELDSELDGVMGSRRAIDCYQDLLHRSPPIRLERVELMIGGRSPLTIGAVADFPW